MNLERVKVKALSREPANGNWQGSLYIGTVKVSSFSETGNGGPLHFFNAKEKPMKNLMKQVTSQTIEINGKTMNMTLNYFVEKLLMEAIQPC